MKSLKTTNTAKTTKQTAAVPTVAVAYDAAREKAIALMAAIAAKLETHGETAPTWGKVGDLSHINGLLAEVSDFLTR